jgi:hypothetical protein
MKNRNLEHKDDWKTPPAFYAKLNNEFNFDFDPCPYMHDMSWSGLEIEWGDRNYINPPYSQKLKEAFVFKAIEESRKGKLCVMLLPVSTSTKIFHEYIQPLAKEIRFIKGRIPFIGINTKGERVNFHLLNEPTDRKNQGMHDSMIVIFN